MSALVEEEKRDQMSIAEIVGGVCAVALAVPTSANEIIGDWDLAGAPTFASLVQGGGPFFDWLNEYNEPIDVNQGFSDFSIIADGFGNAMAGTIIEVTFDAGVVNQGKGVADLVFLEARFAPVAGLYKITVAGYEPMLFLGQGEGVPDRVGFVDSGEDRSFFYGLNGTQDTAEIYGAEIDLSFFGIGVGVLPVPLTLQFEVLTDFRAPLGFGAFAVPTPGSLAFLAGGAFVAASRRRRSR